MTASATEQLARQQIVRWSKSLFDRGYTAGSSGNISVAIDDGFLITPTNSCLGFLEPDQISKVTRSGEHVSGEKPSKEIFLHQAFYDTRPGTGAVVHLHSSYATAVSCLVDLNPVDCIPPLTPYVVMRVGQVQRLPYVRPGDPVMGDLVRKLGGCSAAVLLANHGPVVASHDLPSAVYAMEELEETAKLMLLLEGQKSATLDAEQVADLIRRVA